MKVQVKTAMGSIIVLLIRAASLSAETIPYEFATVDISVTGSATKRTPEDINSDGILLTNAIVGDVTQTIIAKPLKPGSNKFKINAFRCTDLAALDTSGSAINDRAQVVGYCSDSQFPKTYGYIRQPKGSHILLDVPGADHTLATGINDNSRVVGQYYNPLIPNQSGLFRIHGFVWDSGTFSTLDYPLPNTYTLLWAVNKQGQILGEYVTFNPATNETLAQKWFIYDNGTFILDFPESLEYIGGPAIFLSDLNNGGQIAGLRSNGGPDWNGIFVYQSGIFRDVIAPTGWIVTDVRGLNNKGQFVGSYLIQVGIDPVFNEPILERHGFVATPVIPKKPGHSTLFPEISLLSH
jgi:hypothetical protein